MVKVEELCMEMVFIVLNMLRVLYMLDGSRCDKVLSAWSDMQ